MNVKTSRIFIISAIAAVFLGAVSGCSGGADEPQPVPDPDAARFETCVRYSEFGAKGDGVTDDFEAIKAAHARANETGVAVRADDNARYYIAARESTITVKTDTDWGNAEFIVDDKVARQEGQEWWYPLFDVRPDTAEYNMTLPDGYSLRAGQESVGLAFGGDVLLRIVNADKKDFIRYGSNQDSGDSRQEVIRCDRNGRVDASTPILWDYVKVTQMTVYPAAERAIMLRGGSFTTIANDDTRIMHYFNRGIDVRRANTIVKNVKHYVTDEGETGSPYNGFFRANYTTGVTFENCVMTGHKTYYNDNGVSQGTYDTRLNCCNDITYIGCTQYNDMTDTACWGIMCSDYCKNIVMDGCKMSRFDAHKGVYNATVRNCELGQNLSVVGGGTFLMENTTRISPAGATGCNRFITLRYDYGSWWNGDIIIRNSVLKSGSGLNYAIDTSWFDWDFGYTCYFPKTVTLDNVRVEYLDDSIKPNGNYVFGFITQNAGETPEYAAASKNPPVLTDKIILKNVSTVFTKTANRLGWLADTVIIEQ